MTLEPKANSSTCHEATRQPLGKSSAPNPQTSSTRLASCSCGRRDASKAWAASRGGEVETGVDHSECQA